MRDDGVGHGGDEGEVEEVEAVGGLGLRVALDCWQQDLA